MSLSSIATSVDLRSRRSQSGLTRHSQSGPSHASSVIKQDELVSIEPIINRFSQNQSPPTRQAIIYDNNLIALLQSTESALIKKTVEGEQAIEDRSKSKSCEFISSEKQEKQKSCSSGDRMSLVGRVVQSIEGGGASNRYSFVIESSSSSSADRLNNEKQQQQQQQHHQQRLSYSKSLNQCLAQDQQSQRRGLVDRDEQGIRKAEDEKGMWKNNFRAVKPKGSSAESEAAEVSQEEIIWKQMAWKKHSVWSQKVEEIAVRKEVATATVIEQVIFFKINFMWILPAWLFETKL